MSTMSTADSIRRNGSYPVLEGTPLTQHLDEIRIRDLPINLLSPLRRKSVNCQKVFVEQEDENDFMIDRFV